MQALSSKAVNQAPETWPGLEAAGAIRPVIMVISVGMASPCPKLMKNSSPASRVEAGTMLSGVADISHAMLRKPEPSLSLADRRRIDANSSGTASAASPPSLLFALQFPTETVNTMKLAVTDSASMFCRPKEKWKIKVRK